MQIENPNQQDQNERNFNDFLVRQPITNYKEFTLDIDTYRAQQPTSAQQIIKNPSKYYVLIKKYLQTQGKQHEEIKRKHISKVDHYKITIEGNLGANFVTPRGLNSRMANQLVGIQGIITKMDLPKNYLEKSVHWCPNTGSMEVRQYPDSFNPEKDNEINRGRTIRTYDDNNNPMEFQWGLSTFKNTQKVVIQQLPEMAPPGLLPMSVQVILQNQLISSVKPGDRVQMIGIYKLVSGIASKQKGIFKPFFICLSVKPLAQTASLMKQPAKKDFPKDQIFSLFSRSIAPSIWGHQYLKKAVLLMLVGGVQKVLDNSTHLRGDINLLMIGDPGTAKSQMLRWVLSTVDVSVGTTGSGASGVGLTAAIVTQKQTGQKTLQAGAMVLADRGVVCIDQFDKMNETDRVAVHEVMEQQTVTIAKAGLHCSLNARCAVIAAANPLYGQYQKDMSPTRNIGMPDSLLSRFDLVFVILDEKDPVRDQQIAQKVCRNHRLAPLSNEFFNQYLDADDYVINPIEQKRIDQIGIYEKNNVYKGEGKAEILTQVFLKKYINYVKLNIQPDLTDDSVRLSAELWKLLRQKDFNQKQNHNIKVLPLTIRTYESLIRLSTAHAKLLQSPTVQVRDVIEGFRLLVYSLYFQQCALDDEVDRILKELQIDYDFKMDPQRMKKRKNHKNHDQKKEQHKKIQPQQQIRKGMQKMNLKQGQKQADQALSNHVTDQQQIAFTDEQRTMVYKKIADMLRRKKGNQKWILFDQLYQEVSKIVENKKKLNAIVEKLQQQSKVAKEKGKIFIV